MNYLKYAAIAPDSFSGGSDYSSMPSPDYFSGSSDYSSMTSLNSDITSAIAMFGGVFVTISLIIAILQIIAMWKLFTKAGEKGWKSIIPIYNLVILFKISGISPWVICGYLTSFIPIVGIIVCLGIAIYQANGLAKSFGKDIGYTVGLIFVPFIFYLILAFGNAEYVGNTASTDANV